MDYYCPCCSIGIDYRQMKSRRCNNCSHEWENIHVTPNNDTKIHSLTHTCHCEPRIEQEGGNMIIIHNSFDGREGVEQVNEILNSNG